MLATLDRLPKPTVARVHGPAFAGGVGLVAACDIAIGTPEAKFCLSEVKLGLSPAIISPYVMRAIGERAARRYFLTARSVRRGGGLPHRPAVASLVPETAGRRRSMRSLKHLLAGGPQAHAKIKDLIRAVAGRPIDDALIDDTAQAHRRDPRLAGRQGRHRRVPREAQAAGLMFAQDPDRQPRRDRLPRDRARRAGSACARSRCIPTPTATRATSARRRSVPHRPARRARATCDIDAILAAAREPAREAIHPGYGFLSENADFAAACAKAGIVFIGPPPEAIAAMGDKAAAKRLMEKAGVPLVPGYHGDEQDAALPAKRKRRASATRC